MRKIRITVTDDKCEVLDRAEVEVIDGVYSLQLNQVYPFSDDVMEIASLDIGTGGTTFNRANWKHPDAED